MTATVIRRGIIDYLKLVRLQCSRPRPNDSLLLQGTVNLRLGTSGGLIQLYPPVFSSYDIGSKVANAKRHVIEHYEDLRTTYYCLVSIG